MGARIDTSLTTDLIAEKAYSTSASGVFDAKLLHQCTLACGDDYELAFTREYLALEALRGVFIASDDVSRDEMRRASEAWLSAGRLAAIGWYEAMERAQVPAFEAAALKAVRKPTLGPT